MKSIGSLLTSAYKNLGITDRITLNSLQNNWDNLFKEPLSLHTYPVDIKGGELSINVDSPVWLGQLKFFKQDIIAKLSAYGIASVKFKHGSVYRKKSGSPIKATSLKTKPDDNFSKLISDSDSEWIDQTISNINDKETREIIRKAIEKSLLHA